MNWLEIADACEKATGPSREIDARIQGNVENWTERDIAYVLSDIEGTAKPKPYTASLDAIVALIEREFSEPVFYASRTRSGLGYASLSKDYQTPHIECNAATPTLALCAAFARAMHEKGK